MYVASYMKLPGKLLQIQVYKILGPVLDIARYPLNLMFTTCRQFTSQCLHTHVRNIEWSMEGFLYTKDCRDPDTDPNIRARL